MSGEPLAELLSKDQARAQMVSGCIFHGFTEGAVAFNPTYKFDKGTDVYDSGDKQRIPAWTDRVLFKGALLQCPKLVIYLLLVVQLRCW